MGKGRGSAEYFSPQVKEKEKKNKRKKSVEMGKGTTFTTKPWTKPGYWEHIQQLNTKQNQGTGTTFTNETLNKTRAMDAQHQSAFAMGARFLTKPLS